MTKNILEWDWHTSAPNSSAASDWTPAPTLLGGRDPNIDIAAAGDLKCQGVCAEGGSYGTTGAYSVGDKPLFRNWSVKILKIENLPGAQQDDRLTLHEIR